MKRQKGSDQPRGKGMHRLAAVVHGSDQRPLFDSRVSLFRSIDEQRPNEKAADIICRDFAFISPFVHPYNIQTWLRPRLLVLLGRLR